MAGIVLSILQRIKLLSYDHIVTGEKQKSSKPCNFPLVSGFVCAQEYNCSSGYDSMFVSASGEAQTHTLPGNQLLQMPRPPGSLLGSLQPF